MLSGQIAGEQPGKRGKARIGLAMLRPLALCFLCRVACHRPNVTAGGAEFLVTAWSSGLCKENPVTGSLGREVAEPLKARPGVTLRDGAADRIEIGQRVVALLRAAFAAHQFLMRLREQRAQFRQGAALQGGLCEDCGHLVLLCFFQTLTLRAFRAHPTGTIRGEKARRRRRGQRKDKGGRDGSEHCAQEGARRWNRRCFKT